MHKLLFLFFLLIFLPSPLLGEKESLLYHTDFFNAESFNTEFFNTKQSLPLRVGMSISEVIQAWGPALEKEEHETSRREIWRFGPREVVFHEGEVESWRVTGLNEQELLVGENEDSSKEEPGKLSPMKIEPSEAEILLGEILKELPSETENNTSPVVGGGSSPIPAVPQIGLAVK